jgi:hypothetical protein
MTESRLEKFRQLVFASEPLQDELRDLTDRKDFVTRLTDLGAAHGHHFTAADVDEAMRITPAPGFDDHITPTSETFRDWMPIGFHWFEMDPPVVEWCYMGSDRFTDSFFEDTVRRRMRAPFSRLFRRRTPLSTSDTDRICGRSMHAKFDHRANGFYFSHVAMRLHSGRTNAGRAVL